MANMINNKVLSTFSSKLDDADLIGNHYFGISGKTQEKCLRTPLLFKKESYRFSPIPMASVATMTLQALLVSLNFMDCAILVAAMTQSKQKLKIRQKKCA